MEPMNVNLFEKKKKRGAVFTGIKDYFVIQVAPK
jgi:hypothetical protein